MLGRWHVPRVNVEMKVLDGLRADTERAAPQIESSRLPRAESRLHAVAETADRRQLDAQRLGAQ